MRKIGLDLGTTTCGIAISDSTNIIASGLKNLSYTKNDLMQVINVLKKIYHEYGMQIDKFILGYPTYTITNQKTKNTLLVEEFATLLKQNFSDIEIILWSENYTTKIANTYLYEFKIKASKRKKIIDMVSATFILQSYLDSLKK